jgi:hypothetical protein
MNKVAICFLTQIPNDELIHFANEIITRTKELHVYIIIDDNSYQPPLFDTLKFIQIDNEECIVNDLRKSVALVLEKDCLLWDKPLSYF